MITEVGADGGTSYLYPGPTGGDSVVVSTNTVDWYRARFQHLVAMVVDDVLAPEADEPSSWSSRRQLAPGSQPVRDLIASTLPRGRCSRRVRDLVVTASPQRRSLPARGPTRTPTPAKLRVSCVLVRLSGSQARRRRTRAALPGPTRSAEERLLLAADRLGELLLRHSRPASHAELLGALVELMLRVPIQVNATEGLALVLRRARILRPRISRALAVLGLPVTADLLEAALERRVRHPVSPLAVAMLLGRAVVGLGERPLGIRRRALDPGRSSRSVGLPEGELAGSLPVF